MLNQQEKNTGSLVAIIQFNAIFSGSVEMLLVSVESQSLIKILV